MIEVVVHPTGSWGEAEDWAAARVAARTLIGDAREHGCGDPTVSFLIDDVLVRGGVRRSEINDMHDDMRGPCAAGEPADGRR